MKTTMAVAIAFFMMLGTSVYAGGPGDPRPGANPAPRPTTTPAPAPTNPRPGADPQTIPQTSPQPAEQGKPKKDKDDKGGSHGKKKGWYKNPHNPHHPNTNNPGHAKHK